MKILFCADCEAPLPLENLMEDDFSSRCRNCGQLWDIEPDGRMFRLEEDEEENEK